MSGLITLLLTIYDGTQLLRVALQFEAETVEPDFTQYPMEPLSREAFWRMLPEHIRELGKVVEVEQIYDLVVDPVKNVRNFM